MTNHIRVYSPSNKMFHQNAWCFEAANCIYILTSYIHISCEFQVLEMLGKLYILHIGVKLGYVCRQKLLVIQAILPVLKHGPWWQLSVALARPLYVLVQDCNISIANSLEILQSCTKPSISSTAHTMYEGSYENMWLECIVNSQNTRVPYDDPLTDNFTMMMLWYTHWV